MEKILIADHDLDITFILKKILRDETYEVQSCNDCKFLLQLAGLQIFDLIVVNSKMTMADGGDPVSSLQIIQPTAAFIVILDPDAAELENRQSIFHQIRKPIGFRPILNLIKKLFENKGSASTCGISLADHIRMLERTKMTKALLVRENRRPGILLVQEGQVVYADTAELKGERAFHEILSWEDVLIKEIKVKKFPPPNIDKDSRQFLRLFPAMDKTPPEKDPEQEVFGLYFALATPGEPLSIDKAEQTERETVARHRDIPARGAGQQHSGKNATILAVMLIKPFFAFRNLFKNQGGGEKNQPNCLNP